MGGRRATPQDRAAGTLLNYRTGDTMHPDASQARSGGREKYETGGGPEREAGRSTFLGSR